MLTRAEALGCDAIGGLPLAREEDRAMIAREFIDSWNPALNEGHGALAGMIGLASPAPMLPPMRRSMVGK